MSKYRKRPVIVEAEQWFPGKQIEGVMPFDDPDPRVRDAMHNSLCPGDDPENYGWCRTLEGGHRVDAGDWIITGVLGEKYPCKPDVFAQTYETVDFENSRRCDLNVRVEIRRIKNCETFPDSTLSTIPVARFAIEDCVGEILDFPGDDGDDRFYLHYDHRDRVALAEWLYALAVAVDEPESTETTEPKP